MSKYQYYMEQAEQCEGMSKVMAALGQNNLSVFYKNASEGFKIKAKKLSIKEANE